MLPLGTEIEKGYEDWVIGTDPQIHVKKINELWRSGE